MAAEAGVAVSTVSAVLNGVVSARVSDSTRARVTAAATRLNYRPNGLARGLRTQRSQTLALLGDHIATTPYAGRIILGAQEQASQRGFVLMLYTTGGDPEVEQREIRTLLQHQVDGVLYATMYHRRVELPPELAGVPVVLLDATCPDPGVSSVVPDEHGGALEAVRELLRHGHRRIGFVTNVDDVPATAGRLRGYRDALAEAGLPYEEDLVRADVSETPGGYRTALPLLRRADRPTAVFAYNDRMAMGVYRAAHEVGLTIPGDLSVVSFDNQEIIADGVYPGLTTMALPHYEMGAWAVERLVGWILDPAAEPAPPAVHEVLPCPIVRRDSVGPAPVVR